MKSYEVIRKAVDEPGVKAVAAALKVSPALIYKWCEAPPTRMIPIRAATKNPLDRVREMYLLTKDVNLVRWLCHEAGGFFVSDPVPELRPAREQSIFNETRTMMREFSELLDVVSKGVENDHSIDVNEAEEIRQKWEDLKACATRSSWGAKKGDTPHQRAIAAR